MSILIGSTPTDLKAVYCGNRQVKAIYRGTQCIYSSHTHNFNVENTEETYLASAADCTNPAIYYYSCSCGEKSTQTFVYGDALGHNHEDMPGKAATCTEAGYTAYKACSRCDHIEGKNVIEALGHDMNDGVVTTQPTCTTEGVKTFTCKRGCGHTTTEPVAALGHDEVSHEAKAPTCTEIGWDAYDTCSRCDYTTYVEKAALGHDYEAVVTAPTCTADGYTTYTCSVCDDTYVADEVDALGHTEVVDAAVAPTCTETGLTEGKHCSVCNEVFVAQTVVDALGHDCDEEGNCKICGELIVKLLTVTLDGNSTATLKINDADVKTSTTSFTYNVPYGSTVTLTVVANTNYYIPIKRSDIAEYTYASFEEDTTIDVKTNKVKFLVYVSPTFKTGDVTINSEAKYGRIDVYASYEKPDGTEGKWYPPIGTFGSSTVGYNAGPWTVTDFPFGTKVRIHAGHYGNDNSSVLVRPYYYVSTTNNQNPIIYESYYKAPELMDSSESNLWVPGSTTYYLYYIPDYMKLTGTVYFAGYNFTGSNPALPTTYYLNIVANDEVIYCTSLKNIISTSMSLNLNIPSNSGQKALVKIGISTAANSTTFVKSIAPFYMCGDRTMNNINLNET